MSAISFKTRELPKQCTSDSIAFHDYLTSLNLGDVYLKLEELGLDDISIFKTMNETKLEELCNQIKVHHDFDFDFIAKMRFKAAIKKLQKVSEKGDEEHHISNLKQFYSKYISNDIEMNVNDIKFEIDLKFKNIMKTIKKTKSLLMKSVHRWKKERINIVQKEIESIRIHKYNKEQYDPLEIVQKAKDLTQQIHIKFNSTLKLNKSRDYDFAQIYIKNNNCIKIPKFELKKPKITSQRQCGSGYKLKLKWNPQNIEISDIKQQQMVFLYKTNGECWRKCNNYKMRAHSHYVELDELFTFNDLYSFKMEYHIKSPFEYTISSLIQTYSQHKSTKRDKMAQKVKLSYYKHRGHFNECHPMNLLFNNHTMYQSQTNDKFKDRRDYDWIMFKFDHKKYIPSTFYIKNDDKESAVSKLSVFIGDPLQNIWYTSNDIKLAKRRKKQSFDISGFDTASYHFNFIKIVLKNNYGQRNKNEARFCIKQFGLCGFQK